MRLGKEQSAGFAHDDDSWVVQAVGRPDSDDHHCPTPGHVVSAMEAFSATEPGLADPVLESR
jgi:hypothetical protein